MLLYSPSNINAYMELANNLAKSNKIIKYSPKNPHVDYGLGFDLEGTELEVPSDYKYPEKDEIVVVEDNDFLKINSNSISTDFNWMQVPNQEIDINKQEININNINNQETDNASLRLLRES